MRFCVLIIILALYMPCAAFCEDNFTPASVDNESAENATENAAPPTESVDNNEKETFKYIVFTSDDNLCEKIKDIAPDCKLSEDSTNNTGKIAALIAGIIAVLTLTFCFLFWFLQAKNRREREEEERKDSVTYVSTKFNPAYTPVLRKPTVQAEAPAPKAPAPLPPPPPLTPVEVLIADYNSGDKNAFFGKYRPEFFKVENVKERFHFPNRRAEFRDDSNGYYMAVKVAGDYLIMPKFSFIYNDTNHGVHAFGEVFGVLECREVYDRVELVKPAVFSKNGDTWSFAKAGELRLSRK